MEVTRGKVRAVRRIFKKFPLHFLNSPGWIGSGRFHNGAVPLSTVGLEVFCELHPETSTELYSTIQNSCFHHAS
jgi:hypothetical protein